MTYTVYSITEQRDYRTLRAGLVHFRDGIAYFTAPVWTHFVGMTEADVLRKCNEREYTVHPQESDTK